jgi:colicin import membrane protein
MTWRLRDNENMIRRYSSCTLLNKIAIILIATCAVNTWTTAQITSNSVVVTPSTTAVPGTEQQERTRIGQQRDAALSSFNVAKEACYQKFAVNTCISKAQAQNRVVLAELKRRDIALNDAERKRQGVAQLQKTQDKTSPERQADIAAQQGEALAKTAERQAQQAKKQADKKLKLQTIPPAGQAKTPKQAPSPVATKPKVAKTPRSPEEAAAAKALYDKRQLEAAQHRANVLAQQQGKKPAEPLPVPPN